MSERARERLVMKMEMGEQLRRGDCEGGMEGTVELVEIDVAVFFARTMDVSSE